MEIKKEIFKQLNSLINHICCLKTALDIYIVMISITISN